MKKGVLILLGIFMMVSTVEAKTGENLPNRFRVNYSYNNAVNFTERGIEFFVFTNGDFDFDTNSNNYYNRRDNGVRINRDYKGRVRSVGNVFINYDRRGNVTRIGNIYMRYYRGQLTKVGNLKVKYNRWGDPIFYGNVRNFYYDNGIRFSINFGDIFNYNDAYFYRNDFRRNYTQFREDRNFYYYKARANAKIGKRSKILKRRKPTSKINNRKFIKNNRKSYRKSNSSVNIKRSLNTNSRNTDVKRNRVKKIEKNIKKKSKSSYRKRNAINKKIEKERKNERRKRRS